MPVALHIPLPVDLGPAAGDAAPTRRTRLDPSSIVPFGLAEWYAVAFEPPGGRGGARNVVEIPGAPHTQIANALRIANKHWHRRVLLERGSAGMSGPPT